MARIKCVGSSGYLYNYWGSRVCKNIQLVNLSTLDSIKHDSDINSLKNPEIYNFYPIDLDKKKWLTWYSLFFDSVEINCTRYRKLTPSMCKSWMKLVVDNSRFKFVIKVDTYITHAKKLIDIDEWWNRTKDCITEFSGKFYCLLFQFPPTFKRTKNNLDKLFKLQKLVKYDNQHNLVKCAFEFRDTSWFSNRIDSSTDLDLYIYQKKLFLATRWTIVTSHIPPTNRNEPNFGNLQAGIYSFRNNSRKKFVYHRFHGTLKYSSGLYGYTYLNNFVKSIDPCVTNICCFFNNVDTYNFNLETDNNLDIVDSFPYGMDIPNYPLIPSALQDCKYITSLMQD